VLCKNSSQGSNSLATPRQKAYVDRLFRCNAFAIIVLHGIKKGPLGPCGEKVYQTFSDVNPELRGSQPIA